jgi:alpha-glucosidase
MVEEVIDEYKKNEFPLETVYLDIPYMNNYADFTVDKAAFPDLIGLGKKLHDANQKLVVIIDAAVSAEDISENNKYYTQGNKDDIFIKSGLYKSAKYNNNLITHVWPKQAVFVDWFHEKSSIMWNQGLYDLYEQVPYDGIWIDMNEPTSFVNGELVPEDAIPLYADNTRCI